MEDRKRQARWIALLAGTAIAVYLCWLIMKPFIGVITWSIVVVVTFYPIHRRVSERIGRPGWAALLSTLVIVVTILIPLVFVTMMLLNELPELVKTSRELLDMVIGPDSPAPPAAVSWIGEHIDLQKLRSPEYLSQWSERAGETLIGPMMSVVGGIVGGAISLVLMVFTIFFLLRDGRELVSWLQESLPLEVAQNKEIIHRTREMIDASVYGVVILAVLQGTLGGLAFLVLGFPNPFIWGVVMIVLSTIPVTGSFLVWAPAAIYLASTGEWGKAVALTAWGVVVIGLIDNVLRPFVMGQKARLHELLLFFGVLGGLVAFGIAGVVLGPVIIAVALGLLDVIRLSDRPSDAIRYEDSLAEQTAQISEKATEPDTDAAKQSR